MASQGGRGRAQKCCTHPPQAHITSPPNSGTHRCATRWCSLPSCIRWHRIARLSKRTLAATTLCNLVIYNNLSTARLEAIGMRTACSHFPSSYTVKLQPTETPRSQLTKTRQVRGDDSPKGLTWTRQRGGMRCGSMRCGSTWTARSGGAERGL